MTNSSRITSNISKALKAHGFQKAVFESSQGTINPHVIASGFEFNFGRIMWCSSVNSASEVHQKIKEMYECLCQNGFADVVTLTTLGSAGAPVIEVSIDDK